MNFDISSLNDEQKKALFALEGAVLVTAGAGSGKTRLLTHRIAYLICEKGVEPESIIAITFTNKAANEMKERVSKMVDGGNRVWISTFHSMCVRILRSYIGCIDGYSSDFSIYSDQDTEKVLKKILDEKGINDKEFIKKIQFHIGNIKTNNRDISEYLIQFSYEQNISEIIRIFSMYEAELKRNNALDFDDLLIKTKELFVKNPEVLKRYQQRFKYVLVDEFQDTNKIQYDLVRLLSGGSKNVFVVGDEDQSIYSWRGAEFENIFRFTKDFPGCQTFKLERNYRSTKSILNYANKIIVNNKQRFDKKLFTENEQGENVVFKKCYDEQEEASYVAQSILKLVDSGEKFSDIVVLCRLNALTLPFEQAFMSYNIPHRLFGGMKFFERAEIKNIVAFLRLFVNKRDENSLLRIINFPKRGLGDAAIEKIRQEGMAKGFSLLETIKKIQTLNLPKTLIEKIANFSTALIELEELLPKLKLEDFVIEVVKKFGIKSAYPTKSEEDQNKIMNIDSFIVATSEFQEKNSEATLQDYLESISLISDIDSMDQENNNVTIATVHSVKGLEFKNVFVVGLEEKCFPISRAMNSPFDLEEERRLMYVAITRAEQRLFLTCCKTRFMYGKRDFTLQSRFLSEMGLGDTSAKWENEQRKQFEEATKYSDYSQQNFSGKENTQVKFVKPVFKEVQKVVNKNNLTLISGMVVEHPRFGQGVVEKLDGDVVDIIFDGFGKKSLMKDLAPLTIVNKEQDNE
ncbi:MAG: UvrD-helicase domain-containing protein [Clostridia bacterium]